MNPEPMHAIKALGKPKTSSTLREGHPGLLRIEIKCRP
jgi:hypothetical protein